MTATAARRLRARRSRRAANPFDLSRALADAWHGPVPDGVELHHFTGRREVAS